MRKPLPSADDEILEGLSFVREERITRIARVTKKGRLFASKFVRF
jgi:hypothetical protein